MAQKEVELFLLWQVPDFTYNVFIKNIQLTLFALDFIKGKSDV